MPVIVVVVVAVVVVSVVVVMVRIIVVVGAVFKEVVVGINKRGRQLTKRKLVSTVKNCLPMMNLFTFSG